MEQFYRILLLILSLYHFLYFSETSETVCEAGVRQRMSLSINSTRNEEEKWVTEFSASRNVSTKPKNIEVELIRTAVDCQDNYFLNIQGVVKEDAEHMVDVLYFYQKCSSNGLVTNNGRTLKKKADGTASAMTYRPLKDDEIFTVRIDRLDTKYDHSVGIGITTFEPGFDMPDHMNRLKTGAWMVYHKHLYHKTDQARIGYMSKDLKDLKVGQRVGVMRSKTGALHFFFDGVDQGPATTNIPDKVYGVLELFGNLLEGTIVNP